MTDQNLDSSRPLAGLIGTAGLLAVLLYLLFFFMFGRVVPPNSVGIRQNYHSVLGLLEKGFESKGLEPGLHWKIPGISDVILLPRDFQYVHFNSKPLAGDLALNPLDVPTTDGSKVLTDMTLIVRLFDQPGEVSEAQPEDGSADEASVPFARYPARKHGGPSDLIASYSASRDKQLRTFSLVAENELKKNLSELSTTEFYNPVLREEAALNAHAAVSQAIAASGLDLWATLIRRYIYAEKSIDDQIFAKNLQEATERLNAAGSRLAEAQAATEQQRALWDAKIRDLQVEAEAKTGVLRSEGELYEAQKRAQGDLLVAEAVGQVDQAKAQALQSMPGGDLYVARELAPILRTLQGGVISGVDPYDVDKWADKLSGRGN